MAEPSSSSSLSSSSSAAEVSSRTKERQLSVLPPALSEAGTSGERGGGQADGGVGERGMAQMSPSPVTQDGEVNDDGFVVVSKRGGGKKKAQLSPPPSAKTGNDSNNMNIRLNATARAFVPGGYSGGSKA